MADEGGGFEKIYTIPIRCYVVNLPRKKRTPAAVKVIKRFVARHMKADINNIWIDPPVNEKIWERGIEHPPKSIKVRAVKFEEDNLVEVSLPEE